MGIVNIIIYFFIQFLYVYYLTKNYLKKTINYYVIYWCVFLIFDLFKYLISPMYLIKNGINNYYFRYAIFILNINIGIKFFILLVITKIFNKLDYKKYRKKLIKLKNKKIRNLSNLFLIGFILLFFCLSKDMGIINWMLNPRQGYQFYRVGKGGIYALATTFLGISIALRFYIIDKRKNLYFYIIFYLFLTYLLGAKIRIIIFFIFVVWQGINKKVFKLKEVIPLGLGATFLLGVNFYQSSGGKYDLKKIVNYFDYMKNAAMYYQAYFDRKIDLFYGKIFISDFWKYIPRGLYLNKPFIYGKILINEYFYPGMAEKTHTPSFGGEEIGYFADFGIAGVIIFNLLNFEYFFQIICLWKLKKNRNRGTIIELVLFVYLFAPGFGEFFPFGLKLIMLIGLWLLFKIRF